MTTFSSIFVLREELKFEDQRQGRAYNTESWWEALQASYSFWIEIFTSVLFFTNWGTVLWGPAVSCQDILILLTFSCWHLLLHRQEPKYEDEKEQWQLCVWLVSLHIFTFFLVSMGACCWLRKFLLPMYRTYDKLYRFPETWENKKPPDRCTAQPSRVETYICLLALRACIISQVMWIFLVWNSQPACLHLFSTSHGSLLAASFSDLRFCSRTTSASFYHCVLTLEPCP